MAGATMHLEYLGKGNAVLVTIPFNAEDGHRERT
jgi:hypothetical protein